MANDINKKIKTTIQNSSIKITKLKYLSYRTQLKKYYILWVIIIKIWYQSIKNAPLNSKLFFIYIKILLTYFYIIKRNSIFYSLLYSYFSLNLIFLINQKVLILGQDYIYRYIEKNI